MHSAPPVLVPVGRFVWGHRWPVVWAGLGLGVLGLWAGQAGLDRFGLLLLLGTSVGVLLLMGQIWPRELLPAGELAWDGEGWWFHPRSGAAQAVAVDVHWDAGRALLLRVSARSPGWALDRYAWLRAGDMPLQWHGLRCAVHAQHTF